MVSAIDGPTRSAMTPRLVGRELLPSALALNQVIWNGTGLVGPAIAGIVIARADLPMGLRHRPRHVRRDAARGGR